jgi:hypothetical protein
MLRRLGYKKLTYSWIYALIITGAIVILSIIVFQAGLQQELYIKAMYAPLIFLGILSFTRDIAHTSRKKISFKKLMFYAMRTGVFLCVMLYPLIMLFLIYFYSDGGIIKMRDSVLGDAGDLRVLISLEIEIFIVVLVSALVSSVIYKDRDNDIVLK